LQLIKAPLFRGIDVCSQVLAVLPAALAGLRFRPENIRLDPSIQAAARANELVVREGMPFRDAYRRVAAEIEQETGGQS
jgi:argininosuccinate lyase